MSLTKGKNPTMTFWRYFGKKKHSFSNRETVHNQRYLALPSNQFRKWFSVFIIARRSLSANTFNATSVPNMTAQLLYDARSWHFSCPFACCHLCCLTKWQSIVKWWRCKITLNKEALQNLHGTVFPATSQS